MFCEKCGNQLPDGSAFCDSCGAKLETEETATPQPVKEKKPFVLTKQHKIIGLAGIAVVVVAIIVAIILVIAGKNVKLDKYLTVTSEGYNGYGQVNYEVDHNELFKRLTGEDISSYESLEDLESLKNAAEIIADAAALDDGLDVEVKYPEGKAYNKLSNDDVVNVTISLSESAAKRFGVKAKPVTVEHKVSGLKEVSVYDVLSSFTVEFNGFEGSGTATVTATEGVTTVGDITFEVNADDDCVSYVNNAGSYDGNLYVYIEGNTYDLSKGDTVKLICDYDTEYFADYGVILENLEKEYTVDGLDELTSYNVLENYSAVFTGVDGDGEVEYAVDDSEVTVGNVTFTTHSDNPRYIYWDDSVSGYDGSLYVYFTGDTYDLSEGDTVTLVCDYDPDYLEEYGVILEGLEKEFTVEGLGKYAESFEDINEDSLTALSESYQEDLMNRLYDDWSYVVHNSWRTYKDQTISEDMKLHKALMTTPKNTSSSWCNELWLVFSVTLKDDSMDKAAKFYFYYSIEDVAVDADGNLDIDDDYSYYVSKSNGYSDYDELYENNIESFNLNIEEAE